MESSPGFAGHITKDPFLFWFLVVGMNAPWGIVPVILWRKSFKAICSAMAGYVHDEASCTVITESDVLAADTVTPAHSR
jgi:hypothetical protein